MVALASGAAEKRIEVHGHRGARSVLPENTLPAFEHAVAAGADYLELDVVATRDDVLVVSHDPVLNPLICQGPETSRVIRELTLAQLRQWDCGSRHNPEFPEQKAVPGATVPTLEEVFALAPKGNFHFNVETKINPSQPDYYPTPRRFAELLVAAIRKHGLEERVMVQSFDFRTLHDMKRLAPGIRRAALTATDPRDFAAIVADAQADLISPHYRLVTAEKVSAAHRAGIRVVAWTANTEVQWQRLIEAGVDGIITDHPSALIQYLKARGLR